MSGIVLPSEKAENSSFSEFLQAGSSTGFEGFHEGRLFCRLLFKDFAWMPIMFCIRLFATF